MIFIGSQTSCWVAPILPFDYAIANGFDAFEWFPDKKFDAGWDESDLSESQRRSIRETALARGMRMSVHARWEANPTQIDAAPWLFADCQLAHDLGAALLNIHLWHEAGLTAFVDAITPLARRVADAGFLLAIENTPDHAPELFNELFAKLRDLNDFPGHAVGMCLDLGHANLCAATRNDYLAFLDRLQPHVPIIHLHLHENWGDSDSHLTLFTGPAGRDDSGIRGLIDRLQRRRFSGSIILEQWPQPPGLLNLARDRLRELFGKHGGKKACPPNTELHSPEPPVIREKHDLAGSELGGSGRPDFTAALIAADRRCRSWRQKLEAVHDLLVQGNLHKSQRAGDESASLSSAQTGEAASAHSSLITTVQLIDIAIYLRFLGTGEIRCVEDGRHFRPAHHSRIAQEIQQRLDNLPTPEMASIARKIYPWLPSTARTFQTAEPLTRIRDIAHRNDIPSDLKQEIKHMLQNKLHRCAGPEDLVTSAALLRRITAPGANYSAAFVEQYQSFHEELKEFFNAQSLDQQLTALLPVANADLFRLIESFLKQKSGYSSSFHASKTETGLRAASKALLPKLNDEAEQLTTPSADLALLDALTELRRSFLAAARSQRNDQTQPFLLADVGLEAFTFVLLSRLINTFEFSNPGSAANSVGEAQKPESRSRDWLPLMDALRLTLVNLDLSSLAPEECCALDSELSAWRRDFAPTSREHLLRLKATVDRSRRFAEDYTGRIVALFAERAQMLGHAMGVAEHAVRVFCEAEIRGHLVFQLSKLGSALLRRIRHSLALPAWDVIVTGQTTGRLAISKVGALSALLASSRDEELAGKDACAHEPVIALLAHAEGDEEIHDDISGIILGHEIPHLSHLAVRARQAGVVLVACDEPVEFEKLQALQGQELSLLATPENVKWSSECRTPGLRETSNSLAQPSINPSIHPSDIPPVASIHLTAKRVWIPLDEVLPENGGAKAYGTRLLAELARKPGAGFLTPPAIMVPFGVPQPGGIEDIVSVVTREFGHDTPLMVRSSANYEDLEGFARAGLYESIANVAPSEVALAVVNVWASLRTRRAVQSRKLAGIPEENARMAVLIQKMLAPDHSFIIHTTNPINHSRREVYIELAVGLGETLASASVRGTPYRLVYDKESGSVTTLAFASFSQALQPAPGGGLARRTLDYSQVDLSCDSVARQILGRRLSAVASFVEAAFCKPQDIEGAVVGEEIYLVQARPQQGLQP
jgi:phosphoglucan,water dikinase